MFSQFSFGSKCLGTPVPDWIFLPAIKYDCNFAGEPGTARSREFRG
jgi:hypothetical protein